MIHFITIEQIPQQNVSSSLNPDSSFSIHFVFQLVFVENISLLRISSL